MAHRDGGLLEVFENVRRGMIPAHIYNDKELFALEKERLFGRAWTFVGHESEIPHDGDYVVRRVLDDSFIITRDSAGEVRALFNMCLHRGMQVCRAEMGNASNFRCPYHGWTYRNDGRLTGLPFHREAYGGDEGFAKDQTLLPAPNFASYNGLLFISLDPNAEPLEDFLGDFRFYLDYYTKQSAGGVEVRGRSAGGSKRTGRSARRTSPATCTTPHTPTRRSSRSACSASRKPRSARTAPPTGRTAAGAPPTNCPRWLRGADGLRRLPRRDDRPDQGRVDAATAAGRR
ncbi:rieske domain protein [Mycobacterium intracellulare 1956]|uniref:Rieske domain protein n=1 Tax=Mycobacterium intracellulare 1956 TaxID=1299331 RepID=X8CJD1_MYCIT|nr:rieske domain protein [Mycobacterium intracellulare 1956]